LGTGGSLEHEIETPAQQLDFGDDGRAYIRVSKFSQVLNHTRMPGM
jgi:hypothetical protein